MKNYRIALLLICCAGYQVRAGSLHGILLDAVDGKPLDAVQIVVRPFQQTAVTGQDGSFDLTLREGSYTLSFYRPGYVHAEKAVQIGRDSLSFEMHLQPTLILLNEEVTVTANRDVHSAFQSPAAITTLSADELEKNSPRTTPEALLGALGVWLQKTNHGAGSAFMRGLTGNQVLAMIDGIRLNNATFRYGPNQYLNTIDPYGLERIEVLRGYGATLFGSDAIGGVVNALTPTLGFKSHRSAFASARAKYIGEEMEKTGHVDVGLAAPRLSILGGLSVRSFGDLQAGGNAGVQTPTGYDEAAGQIKAMAQMTDRWLLICLWQSVQQKNIPAYDQIRQRGYRLYFFDPQERQLAYLRSAHFSDHRFMRQLLITASLHTSDEGRKRQKNNSDLVIVEHDRVQTLGLQAQAQAVLHDNWQMLYGVEFYRDLVNSRTEESHAGRSGTILKRGLYPDDAMALNFAVYHSHIIDLAPLHLHVGMRYNWVQIEAQDTTFGDIKISPSALAGHLSLLYPVYRGVNGVLNISSSFRAPNINDLSTFGLFDYGIEVPAPNLLPEYAYTVESGVKIRSRQLAATFFVYHTWLRDLIARVESFYMGSPWYNQDRVYQKANAQRAYIWGVESEGQWQLHRRCRLLANSNYCFGQNISDNEPMRRIPPWHGRMVLAYHIGKAWSIETEWQFAAAQKRLSGGDKSDHRIPQGGTQGWNVLNLTAAWHPRGYGVSAGLCNLFDEAYKTHGSGVFMIGRSVWLGIQMGR